MKKIFTIAGLLLLSFSAKSQGPAPRPVDPTNQHITPPPPDVWQFAKYGDYPVSRETGVPSISIPLYEIEQGDLKLPISVSYHAGGVRVDDIASWVGLGWTLNCGGTVSRTVKGLPDEAGNGILNLASQSYDYFDSEGVIDLAKINWAIDPSNPNYDGSNHRTLRYMMDGTIDSEPDVFSYNIDGYSGKFFLDPQRNVVAQPRTDLKIQVVIETLPIYGAQIMSIVMIAPDGKKYTFQESAIYTGPNSYYRNAWYLTRIENSNNTDAIDLFYRELTQADVDPHRTDTYNLNYIGSEGMYALQPVEEHLFSNSEGSYTGVKLLDQIKFDKGKIVFNSEDSRSDSYKTRLTSIDIFDYSSSLSIPFRSWIFDNSGYFTSTGTADASLLKRLKLSSLREKGSDGQLLPPYEFSYLETDTYELPPRLSYAQDYWGYYNGKLSNPSLVPQYQYKYENLVSSYIGNADRNPDAERMKAGIIHKVKYPTGGVTEFTFEANTIWNTYSYTPTIQPYYQASVYNPASFTSDLKSFTPTQNVDAVVHIDLQASGGGTVTGQVYVRAVGSSDFLVIRSNTNIDDEDFSVSLVAGTTYEMFAQAFGNTTAFGTIRWDETGTPVSVSENKIVGGLRVKNIKNYSSDGAPVKQKHFAYTFPTNIGRSSGQYTTNNVVQPLNYMTVVTHQREADSKCYNGGVWDMFVSMTTHPRDKTGMAVSNVVTYEYVTERDEENQNLKGKAIYQYDVQAKDQDINSINSNFALDRGWLRGQLLKESYYDNTNKLVRQVQNSYEEILMPNRIKGLLVSEIWKLDVPLSSACFRYLIMEGSCFLVCEPQVVREISRNQLFFRTYDEKISWKRLTSTTEMVDGVTRTTTFEYDPLNRHTNMVAVQTTNSKNQSIRSEVRYAHEMANGTLIAKNMVSIPLEYDEKVNGVITSGSRITYGSPPASTLFLPIRFEEKLSDLTYKVKYDLLKVSSVGRPEEVKTVDGIVQAYKYGYNNQVLIANAVNANASQIAFTSFESGDSDGGWTYTQSACTPLSTCLSGCPSQSTDPEGYAQCYYSCMNIYNQCLSNDAASYADSKTGRKSFVGTSVSKTGLPTGNYILSFWAMKSGASNGSASITGVAGTQTISTSTWKYFEFSLTSVTSVSLSLTGVRMDDLRLRPVGSQMTTYTASPLIGVTTVTDPNNVITHYTYDSFNRLESVKDNSKFFVKSYLYHFKN